MILFLTDQELDKESGLYNYDARLYDPIVGRFASADPYMSPNLSAGKVHNFIPSNINFIQRYKNSESISRYTYCANNPLIFHDPTGLAEAEIVTMITTNTSFFDYAGWSNVSIDVKGKLYSKVDSWDKVADILSKGDKKVKQLNLSGHGSLGGVSVSATEKASAGKDLNGIGATALKNKEAIDKIKSQLSVDATVTSYGCYSGKSKGDMQKLSNALNVKVKGFTGRVSIGPNPIEKEGSWVEVSPEESKDAGDKEEKEK